MSSLSQLTPLCARGRLRRRFLGCGLFAASCGLTAFRSPQPGEPSGPRSQLFLPLIGGPEGSPDQQSGTIAFNCDLGQSAYTQWYLSGPGMLTVEYYFIDAGESKVRRRVWPQVQYGRVGGWFRAQPQDVLLSVRWWYPLPAWVTFASCVL